MKIKFLIGIILSSLIVFNIFKEKIEGFCDFTIKGVDENGNHISGSVSSGSAAAELCQNTTIYENQNNIKPAEEKLNELEKIVKDTYGSIKANTKLHMQNAKDIKGFADIAAGKDPDTSASCEKYPKTCPDYAAEPYPTSPPGDRAVFKETSLR